MTKRKRRRGLLLDFRVTSCQKCQGQRLLGQSCPFCNARPLEHEMQFDLQRRVRLVASFRERRRSPKVDRSPSFDRLSYELDATLRRVLDALSDVSRSGHSPEPIVVAFASLDQLVASWQLPQPRPHRNRGRIVGESLELLSDGISKFVDALEAPDMLAAKKLERLGNEQIRQAEDVLDALRQIEDRDSLFAAASPNEALNLVVQDARQLAGHQTSLREFDRALRSGAGWNSAAEGLGITLHAVHLAALTSFDLSNFTRVLSATVEALEANHTTQELFSSEEWSRRHARAAAFLGSSIASVYQETRSVDGNDFVIAHRAVEAVSTFRDGVLKHFLASLLGGPESGYVQLLTKNTGKLLRLASDKYPHLMLQENLSPELRNAGAHADIDIVDTGIQIDGAVLSQEEFLDKFLAYLEITLATFVGLLLASAGHRDERHLERYLTPRDRDAVISTFLGAFNLKLDDVVVTQSTMTVNASGSQPDWVTLAGGLSSIPSGDASELSICVSTELGDQVFRASLGKLREGADDLGELGLKATILRMAEIVAGCRLNGRSPWSDSEWEGFSRTVLERDREEDLGTWVKNLRRMRDAAREAGIHPVVDRCEQAIAMVRNSSYRLENEQTLPPWLKRTP